MSDIWLILVQFVFRLTFGMAITMGVTPASLVTSGFYRVHLWVLLGLNTFAALASFSNTDTFDQSEWVFGLAVVIAVLCYVGSVVWLYEKTSLGMILLYLVALLAIGAAAMAAPWSGKTTGLGVALGFFDLLSSGMLLGSTMAAMLLGHWYLNTPTMELAPLKRLVLLMAVAVVIRTILCGIGLALHAAEPEVIKFSFWAWLSFRWLSGLLGTLVMAILAWHTLKVPNTQSATGILYAGVIFSFMGELTSQLLSVEALYPL